MPQKITMRDLISSDAVEASLEAGTKKEALQSLAALGATLVGMERFAVFDVLWERERLGTTGVGQGIAIPHGRVEGLKKCFGAFARLKKPVDFEAIDDKPVDLVFLLLSPADAGADHLQALATVSRMLRDPKLCEKLRAAPNAGGVYKLLTEAPVSQAA